MTTAQAEHIRCDVDDFTLHAFCPFFTLKPTSDDSPRAGRSGHSLCAAYSISSWRGGVPALYYIYHTILCTVLMPYQINSSVYTCIAQCVLHIHSAGGCYGLSDSSNGHTHFRGATHERDVTSDKRRSGFLRIGRSEFLALFYVIVKHIIIIQYNIRIYTVVGFRELTWSNCCSRKQYTH